jgi:hypothetical protein
VTARRARTAVLRAEHFEAQRGGDLLLTPHAQDDEERQDELQRHPKGRVREGEEDDREDLAQGTAALEHLHVAVVDHFDRVAV